MFSMPPATTHSASPARIAWAASATVFNPLPQTLLMVVDGTLSARPAPIADCRAVFCPRPAWSTLPMSTSSTASTPARRSASSTAIDPSRVAGTSVKTPPKVPTGVRAALTMTASSMPITLRPALGLHLQAGAERGRIPVTKRCRVEAVGLRSVLLDAVCGGKRPDPARDVRRCTRPETGDNTGDVGIACTRRVDSLADRSRRDQRHATGRMQLTSRRPAGHRDHARLAQRIDGTAGPITDHLELVIVAANDTR